MKKVFTIFALSLLSLTTWAYDFQVDQLCYNILSETEVEVTYQQDPWSKGGTYPSLSGAITIPSIVTYEQTTYTITCIGKQVFLGCSSLTSVTIPNSVTSIGMQAFYNCSSLTSVTIPNSVTSIGEATFYNCSSLTSVTIPNSVTSIKSAAFAACSSLTNIQVESGNPSYSSENGVLFNADKTILVQYPAGKTETTYTIPEGVTSIGGSAFSSCTSLTSVTIPEGVTSIGYSAFNGCSSLSSVTIPEGVTSIGTQAFCNCSSLTSVTIPNSVTSIVDLTFYGCTSLTSVTIPEGVTSIGDGAFRECTSLTSVTIPSTVTSIDDLAFYYSYPLTTIYSEAQTPPTLGSECFYETNLNVIHVPSGTSSAYASAWGSNYLYVELGSEIELTVHVATPGGLTAAIVEKGYTPAQVHKLTVTGSLNRTDLDVINNDMSSLYDLNLEGINNTTLDFNPFADMKRLVNIVLPANLTSISYGAFDNCSSLTFVTIPTSVISIGDMAFSNCGSLTSVTIPEGVTSIGNSAFSSCRSLTSVTIPEGVTSIGDNTFSWCSSLTSVTIPEGVTSIGERAFSYCGSLTSVTIPNSVTSIGAGAFYYCSSLTSVTIPEGVTSIGGGAFSGCTSLTSVTIPNSVTSIGDEAFWDCSSLTNITIPNSVKIIDWRTFANCSSLTSVKIPSSVSSIENFAFYGCSSLTSVIIADGVMKIGSYTFQNCSSLTSIIIPNSVTKIDWNVFEGCSSLASVTIGNSVLSIGEYAFYDCSNITEMTVLAAIPPTASTFSFYNVNHSIPLYVPAASIGAYRTADTWKEFTNILPIESLTHKQLEIAIEGNGTIQYGETTLTRDTTLYIEPETQTILQLLPEEGYAIAQVVYNGIDYTANVNEDGTLTLPAITENGTLSVQFAEVPYYTISYYVEGSDAYFENDVTVGSNYTVRTKPHVGKTIRSVTLNGQDITSQMQEDGTIELTAIDQDMILIVTCTTTSNPTDFTSQTPNHLRVWQANGTIFAEADDNVQAVMVYDVTGRLMDEYRHNGNYQVITLPAPNQVNLLKVVGKDGNIIAHKLM